MISLGRVWHRTNLRNLCLTLVVAGCGRLGFEPSADFEIVAVTPGWTMPAGGLVEVELSTEIGPVAEVRVDGVLCTGLIAGGATLSCTVPPHAPGSVMLTVSGGAAASDSARFVYLTEGIVQLGGAGDDRTSGIAVDFEGNVLVSGGTMGALDGPNQGDWDALTVKFDAAGTVAWVRQLGGPLYDYARDIAVDGSGNVIVVGHTDSTLGAMANQGATDVLVVSYAPDGTRRWLTTLGTPGRDESYDLGIDASGAAVIAIFTTGDLAAPNAGGEDYALARISSSGDVEWVKQGGSTGNDNGRSIAVAADGTAFLVGWTGGVLDGTGGGGSDMFLIRYDADGTQRWIRQRGGASEDFGFDAQLDATGDIWVAGQTTGSIDGGTPGGMRDVFAMRFAPDGTHQLTRQYGGPGNEYTYGITATATGAVLACDTTAAFGGQVALGLDDLCAIALARDGTHQWTRIFGGPLNDVVSSCARDAALTDFVYFSIITNGDLDGAANRGLLDIGVAKLDATGALR